jgi:cytochrome c-type biogenesis protein CcmF
MKQGDTTELAGHVFKLEEVSGVAGPNYSAARAKVSITRGGREVTTLFPERRHYAVQDQVMTEAAIDAGFTRDLYVSLGDPLGGGAWLLRVQHKPFIDWIWAGCLMMALGGLLAASDRRYRVRSSKERTVLAEAQA